MGSELGGAAAVTASIGLRGLGAARKRERHRDRCYVQGQLADGDSFRRLQGHALVAGARGRRWGWVVVLRAGGSTFRVEQGYEEFTTLAAPEADKDWRATDSNGHEHYWDNGWPTLEWVVVLAAAAILRRALSSCAQRCASAACRAPVSAMSMPSSSPVLRRLWSTSNMK